MPVVRWTLSAIPDAQNSGDKLLNSQSRDKRACRSLKGVPRVPRSYVGGRLECKATSLDPHQPEDDSPREQQQLRPD